MSDVQSMSSRLSLIGRRNAIGAAFLLLTCSLGAQTRVWDGLYGQTGIVHIPVAGLQLDRELTLGGQYIPSGLAHLRYAQKEQVGEYTVFARLGFLPWAEVSIRLVHPERRDFGIGDRSIFLKINALRERQWVPALSVGIYDPMGTQLLPASFVVASKTISAGHYLSVRATAGYGGKWVGGREDYLILGWFGGAEVGPLHPPQGWWPSWSVGSEIHDSRINLVGRLSLRSFLRAQVFLADFRHLAGGISGTIRL